MGKPSVLFRKLINTEGKDGNLCAVNAQQYAVLVMDVPDLIAEHEKCAQPNLVLQSSAFYGFDTCQQGSFSTAFFLDDFAAPLGVTGLSGTCQSNLACLLMGMFAWGAGWCSRLGSGDGGGGCGSFSLCDSRNM
jgi:hypothetical protein